MSEEVLNNPESQTATGSKSEVGPNGGRAAKPKLQWDDSDMNTSYANVVNVSMTQEECGLYFGTNLSTGFGGTGEVTIRLSDRIIMTPYAAKRLCVLLEANLRSYEERFGKLELRTS